MARQTQIRLTPDDETIVDFLRQNTGIQSLTELIRVALRDYARSRGWTPKADANDDDTPAPERAVG